VGIAVGPMLETKRREDRSIFVKIPDAAGVSLGRLIGSGYLGRKLIAIMLLVALGCSILITGEYRVSATSRVEGAVRRVITAPFEGYVASASARPGDVVKSGQSLFEIDDRDLRLERVQVSSERAQMAARLQDALANRERAEVQIINAQMAQADAHLALLDEQIQRTKVSAPFDGVIVSGDLSQSLGAAIERGAVLYEIAPLDRYRVILEVDEHDIADISAGQHGFLLLAALPGEPLEIQVTRLTSVANTTEGANYFRVEADLLDNPDRVRPGMEGVGKIDVEERRLISIWTHKFTRWLKLWVWTWSP
jgi:RND family efflux transporter MFP subunit